MKNNMENQVMSIEQMKALESLGVNIRNSSSMVWMPDMRFNKETNKSYIGGYNLFINRITNDSFWKTTEGKESVPTFTLFDGINMLPRFISNEENVFFLTLMYDANDGVVITYCTEHITKVLHSTGGENQINAVFDMLKWCKENNHI